MWAPEPAVGHQPYVLGLHMKAHEFHAARWADDHQCRFLPGTIVHGVLSFCSAFGALGTPGV